MTWVSWCIKSSAIRLFVRHLVQPKNNENTKVLKLILLAFCLQWAPRTGSATRKELPCHDVNMCYSHSWPRITPHSVHVTMLSPFGQPMAAQIIKSRFYNYWLTQLQQRHVALIWCSGYGYLRLLRIKNWSLLDTLVHERNGLHLTDDIFKCIFLKERLVSNFTYVCSKGFKWQ